MEIRVERRQAPNPLAPVKHFFSSREGQVLLSCRIPEESCMEFNGPGTSGYQRLALCRSPQEGLLNVAAHALPPLVFNDPESRAD